MRCARPNAVARGHPLHRRSLRGVGGAWPRQSLGRPRVVRDRRRWQLRAGPVGPCGRDHQILFDYHPKIRVILPTPDGIRSVKITDLMPLGALWTPDEGTQAFDPAISADHPAAKAFVNGQQRPPGGDLCQPSGPDGKGQAVGQARKACGKPPQRNSQLSGERSSLVTHRHQVPVDPSRRSLIRSACPLWRAYSSIM